MIPMLSAALMVRAARVLPCGRRDRVALVARPDGVVHVAVASLTPSGRWMSRAGRTVCRAHTRRLGVLPRRAGSPDLSGGGVCARCQLVLAAATDVPGLDGRPMTRAQEVEAFELLTVDQLRGVLESVTTVEETHQVGRLATVLFGLPTMKPKNRRTPAEAAVVDLHDRVHAVRRTLTVAELSAEDREAMVRARDMQTSESQRIQDSRRREAARDRALDRQRSGSYVAPHEREHLRSA